MIAEIIKLEYFFQEKERRRKELKCFGAICELIEELSHTLDIEDIHGMFSRRLEGLKLGPKPFTAFIEAVEDNPHLEMMINHLQCLLAEFDMAEAFRTARALFPEDTKVIDLIERDFEAFCLEANRMSPAQADEMEELTAETLFGTEKPINPKHRTIMVSSPGFLNKLKGKVCHLPHIFKSHQNKEYKDEIPFK